MKILQIITLSALSFSLCSASNLHAQAWSTRNLDDLSRWEIGAGVGGALYFGDLTPSKRDYFNEITPYGGTSARYYLGQNFSVRGNLCIAKLAADDSKYDDPTWKKHRNFSFTTVLGEASLMLEYDLLRTNREETGSRWGVYAFAGLGLAYTNPHRNFGQIDAAYFGNTDRAVSGLSEDRDSDPSHIALVAPLGLGASYNVSRRLALFVEGSVRHGFDDKIDGFSKSVSSSKNDAYSFFSLGLNLRINRRGWWI